MNAITITGNLAIDPELHTYGSDNRSLVRFRLGNNERGQDGQNHSNGFFDITAFGPMAEHITKSLKKGDRVIVTGRMQHSSFDRPDGSKGYTTRLIAEAVAASLEFNGVDITRNAPKAPRTEEDEALAALASTPAENPLASMTVKQLRVIADQLGVEGTSKMKKADLLKAIPKAGA